MTKIIPKPVSGNRRLVVVGRIKPGFKTVESTYDSRAIGSAPDTEGIRLGLPEWHPVYPPQAKDWVDEDQRRKEAAEQRVADY